MFQVKHAWNQARDADEVFFIIDTNKVLPGYDRWVDTTKHTRSITDTNKVLLERISERNLTDTQIHKIIDTRGLARV